MTEPAKISYPVRLDDLIDVIKTVHDRTPRTTHRRDARGRVPRRDRRPPDRPFRRPSPTVGRVVDRYRQMHGRHQAGRAEAIRAQGARLPIRHLDPNAGFGRFTPRARNVVVAAQNKAQEAGNHEITPRPPAARRSSTIRTGSRPSCSRVKASTPHVANAVTLPPRADGEMPALIPFSGPAKKALELTFRQALRLGHNYVGTEHIVLALFEAEDDDGPLHRLGVDRDRFESDLVTALEPFTKN